MGVMIKDNTAAKAAAVFLGMAAGTLAAGIMMPMGVQAASLTVDAGEFENSYTPDVTATLTAMKVLEGGTLEANEFEFMLLDDTGTVIDTAWNDEDGAVVFGDITYSETGTTSYYMYEVIGDDANISYDTTVYEISVTVSADGSGDLAVAVSEIPTFTNEVATVYVSAETTANSSTSADAATTLQRTDDETQLGLFVGILIASLSGALLIVIKKWKQG